MLSLFRCISIVEMDQRKGMRSRLTLWELSGGPFGGVPFFFLPDLPTIPGCQIIILRPLGKQSIQSREWFVVDHKIPYHGGLKESDSSHFCHWVTK